MHGAKYSNMAMTEADLIIAAGALSDRHRRVTEFAPNAKIVHIDIDPGRDRRSAMPMCPSWAI